MSSSLSSNRIAGTFAELRARGRKGFVVYLTAGDPSVAATRDQVLRLVAAGADIVELGVPFSDPLADGRVNQEAAMRALAADATLGRILEMIAELRRKTQVPIVIYSYINPLLAHGLETSIRKMAQAGVDGLLVLDLAAEEAEEPVAIMRRHGIAPIRLVTPTSTAARVARIAKQADGFIYCVSRAGVTGARRELSDEAGDVLALARRHTDLPLALGFGISTPEQAAAAARLADAVVVGSALVQRLHEAGRDARRRAAAYRWAGAMARAVHSVPARP